MKSLLKIFGLLTMSSMLFVACGNPTVPTHPMTYVLDLSDSATPKTITFQDNSQYGDPDKSARQVLVDFTSFVKLNLPQIGDKINVTGKITSPIDIDSLLIGVVDDSAAASYWTLVGWVDDNGNNEVDNKFFLKNIKANVPSEINVTFEIKEEVKENVKVQLAYGKQNGDPIEFTVERLKESFIGDVSGVKDPQHKTPKTWDIDLAKGIEKVEMKPEYPWIDGVQDTAADPLCYQVVVDITKLFPADDKPSKGDKINFTWKIKSDIDVAVLQVRAVENTKPVNWWKEIDSAPDGGWKVASDIKAEEATEIKWTSVLTEGIIEGIALCIRCPLDAATGPATFTFVE